LVVVFSLWIGLGLALDLEPMALVTRCRAEEMPAVAVLRHTAYNETTYRIAQEGCAIEWMVRDVEPQVVKHRARCTATLAEQLPLMQAVAAVFYRQDPNAEAFRTLFWGRLTPDETRDGPQEMAYRLALTAFKSPGWDARQGKPKDGDINGFVRKLANEALIYPELEALFARFNRKIRFSSAEKVLVLRADKLAFFDRLKAEGVGASDKLPFDCLAWFSVRAP
jgi:hypothetical protein